MKILFKIDAKDYEIKDPKNYRPAARAIIIVGNKIAMIHSLKYNYFKFPGGGIETNEKKTDALIRETKEESGLSIIKSSIKEFGFVKTLQKDKYNKEVFVQYNYYYLVEVEKEISKQKLDDYEEEESFTLEFIDPIYAIETNGKELNPNVDKVMIERETNILKLLKKKELI